MFRPNDLYLYLDMKGRLLFTIFLKHQVTGLLLLLRLLYDFNKTLEASLLFR